MNSFLLRQSTKKNSVFIWNAVASVLNAGQSVLLLMGISRIDPVVDAGVFTIAYAVANLMVMVGRYGVREFQSSDLQEKYSFKEYNTARIISCGGMFLICGVYVMFHCLNGTYTLYKGCSVFLICLARLVDAYEDVIHGFFQQHGYLETASKIQMIRFCMYMFAYGIGYWLTEDLIWAGIAGVLVSGGFAVLLNGKTYHDIGISAGDRSWEKVRGLFAECFPLFVSVFLSTYLGNAPKYAIDTVLTDEMQARFNYIFMPVFVITLLSMFIYQPMVVKYANYWMDKDMRAFIREIRKQSLLLASLLLLALIAAFFWGIPVLSAVFAVDLIGYRTQLLILIVGGGMLAYVNYFTMLITVMRYQKLMFGGYIVVSVCFLAFGRDVVRNNGAEGLCVFYTVAMLALALYCLLLICRKISASLQADF